MNKQEAKADAGKLEIDLVPTQIIRDIAEVRMYGNQKYGDPDNWKTVELRRYINALLRHTLAFKDDHNSIDEESGIAHYKHMACNLAFICELLKDTKPKLESVLSIADMDKVIQKYCHTGDECEGCRITLLCDEVGGDFKRNEWACRAAYDLIKEEMGK